MSLKSLTIEYLNKCNLSCRHCAADASWDGQEKLGLEDAKNWIWLAKEYGAGHVYICGGEPFLVFKELLQLVERAGSLALSCTVFSNAFWAKTLESTYGYLRPLKNKGLSELNLSLDCFHLEAGVPFQNFLNAASVSDSLNLKLSISFIRIKGRQAEITGLKKRFRPFPVDFRGILLRPVGRAVFLDRNTFVREKKNNYKKGCRSYGNLIISPRGEVFACKGAYYLADSGNPFKIGNVYELPFRKIIEKFSSLKLSPLIATLGVKFVHELIRSEPCTANNLYACELCCRLLNNKEKVDLINEKIENPDSVLKARIALAEVCDSHKDRLMVKLPGPLLRKLKQEAFSLLFRSIRRLRKGGVFMCRIKPESLLVKSSKAAWKKIDDRAVLLNLSKGEYFTLEKTGIKIWEAIEANKSLKEIAQAIAGEYEISYKRALSDVIDFVKKLFRCGFLEIVS